MPEAGTQMVTQTATLNSTSSESISNHGEENQAQLNSALLKHELGCYIRDKKRSRDPDSVMLSLTKRLKKSMTNSAQTQLSQL